MSLQGEGGGSVVGGMNGVELCVTHLFVVVPALSSVNHGSVGSVFGHGLLSGQVVESRLRVAFENHHDAAVARLGRQPLIIRLHLELKHKRFIVTA